MARVIAVWIGLMLVALGLFVGCGGEKKSTSSEDNKNFIRFENKYSYGNMTLHVTIGACHQEFDMRLGDVKVVECVPEDGSTEFLVVVEAPRGMTWSAMVSGGQTVTLEGRGTNEAVNIYCDGENCMVE